MIQGFPMDWAWIGATLANQDDETQATFFKALCKEMRSWPTSYARECQMLNINAKLTPEDRDLLLSLGYERSETSNGS